MKVLVCPLDWGLGHATRCIPLIRALVRAGHEVLVGASGGGLRLLRAEFPGLEVFDFPGYPIRYSRSAATLLPVLLAQLPGLLLGMLRERSRLREIVSEKGIDRVISDGRYGVRTREVPAIFVTHQIFIRIPGRFPGSAWAERALLALNLRLLRGFREVWVPDFPGEPNLSGELSHEVPAFRRGRRRPLPGLVFINPLSRFQPVDRGWEARRPPRPQGALPVDVLASVSGPEPQRTRFEEALRRLLGSMSGTRVLIRGVPGGDPAGRGEGVDLALNELNEFPHLDGPGMEKLFRSAALVVARSGYTTVMEMASLGLTRVVLVPTPGQSEQEYLADHLDRAGIALRMDQDGLDLRSAQKRLGRYAGFSGFDGSAGTDPDASGAASAALSDFIADHPLFRSTPGG